MKIRVHFNKKNAKDGLPWTVHTSKACIPAAHVLIHIPIESEEKPLNKTNPRYFFVCNGIIELEQDNTVVISPCKG
jgi:hypothetical protein